MTGVSFLLQHINASRTSESSWSRCCRWCWVSSWVSSSSSPSPFITSTSNWAPRSSRSFLATARCTRTCEDSKHSPAVQTSQCKSQLELLSGFCIKCMEARFHHRIKKKLKKLFAPFFQNCIVIVRNSEKSQNCEINRHNYLLYLLFHRWKTELWGVNFEFRKKIKITKCKLWILMKKHLNYKT